MLHALCQGILLHVHVHVCVYMYMHVCYTYLEGVVECLVKNLFQILLCSLKQGVYSSFSRLCRFS